MKKYKVYLSGNHSADVYAASRSLVGWRTQFFDAQGVEVADFVENSVLGVVEVPTTATLIRRFFSSLFSRPFNLAKIHPGMSKDQKDAVWHEINEKIHQDNSSLI